MQTFKRTVMLAALAAALIPLTASVARAQWDPVGDARGVQANREYVSKTPWEVIDSLTGNLILQFTDLVLPGNAGRDLRFQRTYNLKNGGWSFGLAELPMQVYDAYPSQCAPPVLFGADGSTVEMVLLNGGNMCSPWWITDQFWKFDRYTHKLYLPDGSMSTYAGWNGSLSSHQDAFGNQVTLSGWGSGTLTVTQGLGNSEQRVITLSLASTSCSQGVWGASYGDMFYDGNGYLHFLSNGTCNLPSSMSYAGRTWTYTWSSTATANLPEGVSWQYASGSGLTVTTPNGGSVHYGVASIAWGGDYYEDDGNWYWYDWYTPIVTTRAAYDRGGAPLGTWSYSYASQGSGLVLTAPDGTKTTYAYNCGGSCYNYTYANALPWACNGGYGPVFLNRFALLASRTIEFPVGTVLETETRTYQDVSQEGYCAYAPWPWWTSKALPAVASRAITRQGMTFTTTYSYNGSNYGDHHQPNQIVENGNLSRTTTRTYEQNEGSRVQTETVTVNGESLTITKSWAYDPATHFKTSETIAGVTTAFTADVCSSNPSGTCGNVASSTQNGHITNFLYSFGLVKQITLPNNDTIVREIDQNSSYGRPVVTKETRAGRVTTFSFDDILRVTSTQPPGGSSISAPTTVDYFSDRTVVTRGSAHVTTNLDGFGRATCTINSLNVQTCTTYDSEGRISGESLPTTGALTYTIFTYDHLGRLTQKTNPNGTSVSHTFGPASCSPLLFSCLNVTIQDEKGNQTVRWLKAFGHPDEARLMRVVDAAEQTWDYLYNALGNLTCVKVPGGAPGTCFRSWTYGTTPSGVENVLISDTQPESGTTNYEYYAGTRLLHTKTDAKGTVFTYTYDANDRLTQVSGGGQTKAFTFEAGSDNRATMSVTGGGSTTFTYDPATGRLTGRSDAVNGQTFDQIFAYDSLDQLTTLTYPKGRRVGYVYNAGGQITRVFNVDTDATYASSFTYHASGAAVEYVGFNSKVHQFAFQPLTYRLSSMGVIGDFSLGYTYDNVGNVTQITDGRSSYTQTFGYDALNRLISATGIYGSPCWSYDAHGNRTTCGVTSYEYFAGTNRLKNQSGIEFTFDANGNVTGEGGRTFAYTPDNQVASTTLGVTTTSYQYDADGWRLLTQQQGQPNRYVVRAPNGGVLMEWDGTLTRDSIYAGGRLIAWAQSDLQVFDVTTDALGSVRMVSNAAQTVIERHDYLPFGEEWAPPASISPVKFAGKERDTFSETQRDYLLARFMRANSGRFMSPDHWSFANPLNPQSWNLYVYVLNNPLRFVDPSGHCEVDYGEGGEEDDMSEPRIICNGPGEGESITVRGTGGTTSTTQTGSRLGDQDFGPRSREESTGNEQSGSGGALQSLGNFLSREFVNPNGCGRVAASAFLQSLVPLPFSAVPDGKIGVGDVIEHTPATVAWATYTRGQIGDVYPHLADAVMDMGGKYAKRSLVFVSGLASRYAWPVALGTAAFQSYRAVNTSTCQ